MRVYLAMFALCIIAVIMISEPHYSPTLPQNNAQTQPQSGVTTTQAADQNRKPCHDATKSDSSPPKWYAPLERPEWWLVILGFPTLAVLLWQAIVSGIAARAAAQNIELYINKERARVRIEMKPLVFPSESDPTFSTVDFTVSVYGQTDAFITSSLCVAYIFPWSVLNNQELGEQVMFPIHSLPSVISANAPPVECSVSTGLTGGSDNIFIEEAKAKRMFVGMRGFIKYKDVFDRERETAFRYVWRYSEVVADWGQWEKSGNPEENRET